MLFKINLVFIVCAVEVFSEYNCYWKSQCPYQLYSSKTPYDTVRGDLRDISTPNCEAVSLWHLQRHGNRNPGSDNMNRMKYVATLRDEIIQSYEKGRNQLCAQDIEELKKFTWNSTIEESASFLTGQGYEEIFQIATRIRHKHPQLLNGLESDYYFRPTKEQRTVTSGIAFMHGLTEDTNLTNLILNAPGEKEDIIRPYEDCERYQIDVKNGSNVNAQLAAYDNSPAFLQVKNNLQRRLGIETILTNEDTYAFYDICRFYRSWSEVKRSPWCSVFTDEELIILEYRDDVRHYWRNGYGSRVNSLLGGPLLRDLYEIFNQVRNGGQMKVTAYFTHDTMMEMMFSALGIFNDYKPIRGDVMDKNRLWKTSYISPFSTNFMAVLNKCTESSSHEYRVQFLLNENEIEICKPPGCSWQEFENKFISYNASNFEFCDMNNIIDYPDYYPVNSSLRLIYNSYNLILLQFFFILYFR